MSNHLRNMLADFYCARDAWQAMAEYETMLYPAELAEYKLTHPMPQWKDWLKNQQSQDVR